MMASFAMVPTLDFIDFTQLFFDETSTVGLSTGMPPPAAHALPNYQFQSSYALRPPNETSLSQDLYDAPRGTAQYSYLPLGNPPNSSSDILTNASPDDRFHTTRSNEVNRMGLSEVGLAGLSAVLPVIPQPLPIPPLLPIFALRWTQVPQRPYDHGRRQWNFGRLESVPFSVNGLPGINMGEALRKQFTGLDGRDDPVLQGSAGVISCRLMFPGYPPNASSQISTLGWAKNRVRISRSKLAYEVAKKLDLYLNSMTGYPIDAPTDQRWKIGEGFMHLENLYLVRLVSVSKGSFQPEIWALDTSI